MLVLLGIALLAGAITAISPCVLPVLPILLAGSAAGHDPKRPYLIIAGLVVSFTSFTLGGAWLLNLVGLPEDFLRNLAIALLLLLAATLLVPQLAYVLERPLLFLTRRRVTPDRNGFVLGLSVGLVFVPCAGPVLAAMTALAATGRVGFRTVLVTLAYAIGAALPMLAVAVGGQRLSAGLTVFRRHAEATRRVAGAAIGATAIAIAWGADQRFTTAIPGYTEALQGRIERSDPARRELRELTDSGAAIAATTTDAQHAPEFQGLGPWLNTRGGKPLTIAGLRGKVVLVDFWTYSCINCLRTLPQLRAWDQAYRGAGLVIVGVHTPEFAFERVAGNVRSAVRRLGIGYPVALDNGFRTWNAYRNQYWPAKYLIDRSGRVRYTHFGEGAYGETEATIRQLLGERAATRPTTSVADRTPTEFTTPESYLGYLRIDRYRGSRLVPDTESSYRFAPRLDLDELTYAGRWRIERERIVAGDRARVRLRFRANDVFLVLSGRGRLDVLVDGRPLRTVRVAGTPRLYSLARFPSVAEGLLELRFAPGLAGYAFTFG
jgi:cytochrome c biogenesis protein CcdA/thiol-disulfide isomerase/thioredoxin